MKYYLLIMLLMVSAFAATADNDVPNAQGIRLQLLNQDPDPALAGDIVDVRIGISNAGGAPVDDLEVEILSTYPFFLPTGEPAIQNAGTLRGFQGIDNVATSTLKILKYKLRVDKDAPAGEHPLYVRYYAKDSGYTTQVELSLNVKNTESAEIIKIDQSTLLPGKETSMRFTITNVGKAPLKDLKFSWSNEDDVILPVGSDNTRYIKNLDLKESKELEYKVMADPNADPGLYSLALTLTYQDPIADEETTVSTTAGIYVGGGTDFEVAYSSSVGTDTSLSIANIGGNSASSVVVLLPEQHGWMVTGSNSVIIGNLNKGDYTIASFSITSTANMTSQKTDPQAQLKDGMENYAVHSEKNATHLLTVNVEYTDTMGNRRNVQKQVRLGSSNGARSATFQRTVVQSSSLLDYKWYFIGAATLVGAWLLYRSYRKKKMME